MIGIKRATVLRPHGHILTADAAGRPLELDTIRCCHCGAHFTVQPGSGRSRGWCHLCGAPTCGQRACDACRPLEEQLRRMER